MSKGTEKFRELGIMKLEDALSYVREKREELALLQEERKVLMQQYEDAYRNPLARKKQMQNVSDMDDMIRSATYQLFELEEGLFHLTRFSPKLLLEYILLHVEEHEKISFEFFEDVRFSEYESTNQAIRQYMARLTGDNTLLFKNYCKDKYTQYHLLLPVNIDAVKDEIIPDQIPVLCFPSQKKVRVLDDDFKLTSKLQSFPYLEPVMKDLVEYRFSHPELTQKEILIEKARGKKHDSVYKTYQI